MPKQLMRPELPVAPWWCHRGVC